MRSDHRARSGLGSLLVAGLVSCTLAACGGDDAGAEGDGDRPVLTISAIPDQDPAELTAREEALADYLGGTLDVEVEYVPVTDYAASVTLFGSGDLDLVFYGGLTGVQARLQTPGATVLAQRDIDAEFHSVFIANADAGIEPIADVDGLDSLAGTRFTFGSESSTSGRMMPAYFLDQAGVDPAGDFAGEPGFSGSHDKTIDLVQAGSYEAGVLNTQVWDDRLAAGTVDQKKVVEIFRTPSYHDYHWIAGPSTDDRFGDGFTEELRAALIALDGSTDEERTVLEGYGAAAVVPTEPENYDQVEEIARQLGLVS
ncbi:putative selenate ABC transporter substrate-binding protein [Nocardioides pantholopis]|uniref:putative selenate ABC transporter substrate-binding protein n=1 Tax=Nocardioides pantholopis TaxID=2483798 RepID=UPI000FDC2E8A|nr:putative selenate ABC transporter substrate-binding protein [Nocardioides pantholopis]